MAMMNKGALAAASEEPGDPNEEPGEAAENETAGYDEREKADPSLEENEPGEQNEPPEPGGKGAAAAGVDAEAVDPKMMELVQLVAARAPQAAPGLPP